MRNSSSGLGIGYFGTPIVIGTVLAGFAACTLLNEYPDAIEQLIYRVPTEVVLTCQEALRKKAGLPREATFAWRDASSRVVGGRYVVDHSFDSSDFGGLPIPSYGSCVFPDGLKKTNPKVFIERPPAFDEE